MNRKIMNKSVLNNFIDVRINQNYLNNHFNINYKAKAFYYIKDIYIYVYDVPYLVNIYNRFD